MKKVIGNKLYNTETAEELHSWDNGCYSSDFEYCHETLYRTKKGAYFIHGYGGPKSKYARPAGGNSVTGGEDIRPVTEKEAMQWLEDHGGTAVLIELFGDKLEEA